MEIQELVELSPLRVFDESINGGLGRGNLGVLVSRHGVGKTACLVQLATDKLFKGEQVIHVSFSGNVEHVVNWYKEVFRELSDGKSIDDPSETYSSILANRVVMNFNQEMPVEKVLSSLETLIDHGSFKADAILFDGYRLTLASEADLKQIKAFVKKLNLEAWFAVSPEKSDTHIDEYGVPETVRKYLDLIDVLIGLTYDEKIDKVIMNVVKSHGVTIPKPTGVVLDPKTMLLAKA